MAQRKKTTSSKPKVEKVERDENGLIVGVDYKFNEDGLVDWKAMIPKKFLYVNTGIDRRADIEKKYGKPIDEIDVAEDNVEDRDLVIMLGGIKHLLKLRGYHALSYAISDANADYAAVACKIRFKPNYETEGEEKVFESMACAHYNNTSNWYSKYLLEAAENRSFCRCVRNFLGINIVSKEELGKDAQAASDNDAPEADDRQKKIDALERAMVGRNLTWEQLKEKLEKAQTDRGSYKELDLNKVNGTMDLPNDIIFDITSKLKKTKSK